MNKLIHEHSYLQGSWCYFFHFRTQLAILHFNENANREQAVSADGSLQFKIKHPKSRKGVKVVRPKQAEPTYSK